MRVTEPTTERATGCRFFPASPSAARSQPGRTTYRPKVPCLARRLRGEGVATYAEAGVLDGRSDKPLQAGRRQGAAKCAGAASPPDTATQARREQRAGRCRHGDVVGQKQRRRRPEWSARVSRGSHACSSSRRRRCVLLHPSSRHPRAAPIGHTVDVRETRRGERSQAVPDCDRRIDDTPGGRCTTSSTRRITARQSAAAHPRSALRSRPDAGGCVRSSVCWTAIPSGREVALVRLAASPGLYRPA